VFFPVSNQVVVVRRRLSRQAETWNVDFREPIALASRASEGGNLLLVDRWLLLATPSRLVAFESPEIPKE